MIDRYAVKLYVWAGNQEKNALCRESDASRPGRSQPRYWQSCHFLKTFRLKLSFYVRLYLTASQILVIEFGRLFRLVVIPVCCSRNLAATSWHRADCFVQPSPAQPSPPPIAVAPVTTVACVKLPVNTTCHHVAYLIDINSVVFNG